MLRVERLEVGYGDVPVLPGLGHAVGAGEIAAVVGSDGAGRRTLAVSMGSTFALWDLEAGNLVGAFDTEAAARAVAAGALADQGPHSVETLARIHEDEHGELTIVAEGLDLVRGQYPSAARHGQEPRN